MNKTLWIDGYNKKIKTTESLQKRFSTEVKPCNRNRETNGPSIPQQRKE